MTTQDKIDALRVIMKREGIFAYIISGTDPHNSEYLPAAWKSREWISGFTGSAGTAVVTLNHAGIWTDTRYFIQIKKEIEGSEFQLHKLRVPEAIDYPEWLSENVPAGEKVGFDGFCTPISLVERLKNLFKPKGILLADKSDLIGELWIDRPSLPSSKAFLLDTKYSGLSTSAKISRVRDILNDNNADMMVFSVLDQIAWLFNIRANDIEYNPVVLAYAIVTKERCVLFALRNKIDDVACKTLKENGVDVMDYHHLLLYIEEMDKDKTCIIDASTLNYAVFNALKGKCKVISASSPIDIWKAIKNETEINGFKKAHIRDGVALTKFYMWLEEQANNDTLPTEIEAEKKLQQFRCSMENYFSDSFHYISAYGINAALPHYTATEENNARLEKHGLFLMDTGAQYFDGTTDITRCISLGSLTEEEKMDYTMVLKGNIALSKIIFPVGTPGAHLDILARQFLWENEKNFGHGTGHGVGHFLCVHEGPQDVRQNLNPQPIEAGMIISDEPGMYVEGKYGIRHENLLLCVDKGNNMYGHWLGFEPLTMCFFDTTPLIPSLMDKAEIEWLNNYHKTVFNNLSPFLNKDEQNWLKNKTKSII